MPSVWIVTRATKSGEKRYRVEYRLGGRESPTRYGGSFQRKADAVERKLWIGGELAGRRVPYLGALDHPRAQVPTFAEAAQQWLASRLGVTSGTKTQHRTSVNRAIRVIGSRRIDEITPQDIAAMVAELHAAGVKRSYLRKILQATAMTFDHVSAEPNPARDRRVELPPDDSEEVNPPTAEHVLAAFQLMPRRYRLPLLTLDDTGMRITELEKLEWRDVDEPRGRWRVRKNVAKGRHQGGRSRARWVNPHTVIFAAVVALRPRDDRSPDSQVFDGFDGDAFRTQLARVCTAAAVPAFSPHDLRHRRISLLHLRGVPWARIGEAVGQRSLSVTADTYSHVLADEVELDYAELLERDRDARPVPTPVPTSARENGD